MGIKVTPQELAYINFSLMILFELVGWKLSEILRELLNLRLTISWMRYHFPKTLSM